MRIERSSIEHARKCGQCRCICAQTDDFHLFLYICGITIQGLPQRIQEARTKTRITTAHLQTVGSNTMKDACVLRGLCQRGGRRLLSPRDPLLAPLRDLCTLLGDEYPRALVPPMRPVSEIAKGEHRDEMSARICWAEFYVRQTEEGGGRREKETHCRGGCAFGCRVGLCGRRARRGRSRGWS